jgi:hypothetical protein
MEDKLVLNKIYPFFLHKRNKKTLKNYTHKMEESGFKPRDSWSNNFDIFIDWTKICRLAKTNENTLIIYFFLISFCYYFELWLNYVMVDISYYERLMCSILNKNKEKIKLTAIFWDKLVPKSQKKTLKALLFKVFRRLI